MNKPPVTLHFAHANGFPAGTYRKLFEALPSHFRVLAIDKFGHNERFPISNNWHNPAQELNDYVDQQLEDEQQQVIAVGHSFGAVVSYIAACKNPSRFCGLIMLDPPLASGFSRHLFKLAKRTPLIDKITPARLAHTRAREWHHSVDMVDYFANKGLFRSVDRDCIADYVASVIAEQGAQKTLTFDPAIEAEVFRTIPDNLNRYSGKLQCPAVIVTGAQTDICVPFLRNAFIRDNQLHHEVVQGGHLFPLERPIEVAETLVSLIDKLHMQPANHKNATV